MNNIANSFAQYAANPEKFETIEGVSPEIALRLPGFADFGMDGDDLVEAVRKAGKSPVAATWGEVLIEYGNLAMNRGELAQKQDNSHLAEKEFMKASFWYFLARFPHIMNDTGMRAYQLHNEAYLCAARHSRYAMEIVDIIVDGKKGRAFLRLPNSSQLKYSVVMLAGGVDTWKSELEVHNLSDSFLEQGMATLQIDIPGTGECPISASDQGHAWFLAALDKLKNHPRIDGSKMSFYGLSFGGYWATKMAFIAPWLSGVVNNGGPIHHTFQPLWLQKLPMGLKKILALMLGFDHSTDLIIDKLAKFSLFSQGLLNTKLYAPILNINGAKDEVVSIDEISFLNEQNIHQDTLIFGKDRHVASRNWFLHNQFAARWLSKHLK